MIHPNGHTSTASVEEPAASATTTIQTEIPGSAGRPPDIATRAKLRAKPSFQQNRFVIIGAGAIVVALLLFVATSMPHKNPVETPQRGALSARDAKAQGGPAPSDKSLFPITDSGRTPGKESHQGFLDEQDLERSATRRSTSNGPRPVQSNAPGTLGSIPPFGADQQSWQAPPFQSGDSGAETLEGRSEREAMEKSSLVYVRRSQSSVQDRGGLNGVQTELGLGLETGTRLRARLESAASTAVRSPILAVIEYNYERDGQIVVPAGAKAVGHLQEADRTGYVHLQFDALMMPDGASVPIEAVATDLHLRPLKGKVEGKNTGKNILVRSLSGIGEAGALLLGQGNLNQPYSESDLMRERVSNNIGEAGDEEVSRMAVTQRIVVTIPADTPIYVVLEQTPKATPTSAQPGPRTTQPNMNADQLRQLLQLQRELNQSVSTNP